MSATNRITTALERALELGLRGEAGPPKLSMAVRDAIFPGGSRLRPQLCLAVAAACGDQQPEVTDAAAAAVELLHCASLVHDDLPCFDDADTRRGQPSIHVAHGQPLAVLCGDALIVLAFEQLAMRAALYPAQLAPLVQLFAGSVGMARGLCAGQGWECETNVNVSAYHLAKTGALFAAATTAGALSVGADPAGWQTLGAKLGEAYQVADDLRDVAATAAELGKPTQRDIALNRPSAVAEVGAQGALARLNSLVAQALDSIPACPGADQLRGQIELQAAAFLPPEMSQRVA
ncbi:MAG: polyprenyl synthetase family protein [Pseudomonadales bacterium]